MGLELLVSSFLVQYLNLCTTQAFRLSLVKDKEILGRGKMGGVYNLMTDQWGLRGSMAKTAELEIWTWKLEAVRPKTKNNTWPFFQIEFLIVSNLWIKSCQIGHPTIYLQCTLQTIREGMSSASFFHTWYLCWYHSSGMRPIPLGDFFFKRITHSLQLFSVIGLRYNRFDASWSSWHYAIYQRCSAKHTDSQPIIWHHLHAKVCPN